MLDQVKQLVSVARDGSITITELLQAVRKEYITASLRHHRGNQCKAALELKMHRNTLSRVVDQLDINPRGIRTELTPPKKKPARVNEHCYKIKNA